MLLSFPCSPFCLPPFVLYFPFSISTLSPVMISCYSLNLLLFFFFLSLFPFAFPFRLLMISHFSFNLLFFSLFSYFILLFYPSISTSSPTDFVFFLQSSIFLFFFLYSFDLSRFCISVFPYPRCLIIFTFFCLLSNIFFFMIFFLGCSKSFVSL